LENDQTWAEKKIHNILENKIKKKLMRGSHVVDLGIDGEIILKCILEN
jgi:hypothetical protein